MIEAHTVDAWTRTADRSSAAFGYLMLLGGFAAPLFLWLAGVGLVLSADQVLQRSGDRSKATEAIVRRGAQIFLLAFLFRIQAFIVSPGSYLVTIFRVDILNVMGPGIAAAGLVWGLSRSPRRAALVLAVVATTLAMATPVLRTAEWVQRLAIWLQWYVRPYGDNTTFTMFPWVGFVFAGAAYGALLTMVGDDRAERFATLGLVLAGVAILAIGVYTSYLPTIYRSSSFWTSSPTYFAVRVGTMMLVLAALFWIRPLAARTAPAFNVLARFGRNSLFVYWIHVELVYGYATWLIHRRLTLGAATIAYLLFSVAMFAAILLKDSVVSWWRAGRSHGSAPNNGSIPAQA